MSLLTELKALNSGQRVALAGILLLGLILIWPHNAPPTHQGPRTREQDRIHRIQQIENHVLETYYD